MPSVLDKAFLKHICASTSATSFIIFYLTHAVEGDIVLQPWYLFVVVCCRTAHLTFRIANVVQENRLIFLGCPLHRMPIETHFYAAAHFNSLHICTFWITARGRVIVCYIGKFRPSSMDLHRKRFTKFAYPKCQYRN